MIGRRSVAPEEAPDTTAGPARVDRRTKELTKRLRVGDVAIVDHEDLDRVAVRCLIDGGVRAVVNAAKSLSGRYPNEGPLLLAAAGIPLVDGVGSRVLELVREGDRVSINGSDVCVDGRVVATGVSQNLASLARDYEAAKAT
ncbi:MAG: hypothetical protein ABIW46_02130, partial [Acidimicrobiales bacterium]